ncbi:hypothetical protein E5D57_008086 [Metarhizium anisopliae]|nr:hypothetical protein E5D57_008086 [Metarhizium anisopliae]
MEFEEKSTNNPETSANFVEISPLGWVAAGDLDRMRHICMSIPPPKKQFNSWKRLYPKEPLRRCQEWTNEAIDSLTRDGSYEWATDGQSSSVGQTKKRRGKSKGNGKGKGEDKA